jgi:hypothetical protein
MLPAQMQIIGDIYAVSAGLGLKSYLWGGFAVDFLHGSITREHGDVDAFTENMVENIYAIKKKYEALGYEVKYHEDFWMLNIEKDGAHATFNTVKNICGIAHWYHAGPQGTVFFPYDWLDTEPRVLENSAAYTCGVKLLYALKAYPVLVRASWLARQKDAADLKILQDLLSRYNIPEAEIKKRVWAHNPYWYAQGYEEFYWPVRLDG